MHCVVFIVLPLCCSCVAQPRFPRSLGPDEAHWKLVSWRTEEQNEAVQVSTAITSTGLITAFSTFTVPALQRPPPPHTLPPPAPTLRDSNCRTWTSSPAASIWARLSLCIFKKGPPCLRLHLFGHKTKLKTHWAKDMTIEVMPVGFHVLVCARWLLKVTKTDESRSTEMWKGGEKVQIVFTE